MVRLTAKDGFALFVAITAPCVLFGCDGNNITEECSGSGASCGSTLSDTCCYGYSCMGANRADGLAWYDCSGVTWQVDPNNGSIPLNVTFKGGDTSNPANYEVKVEEM
jgi:hypothetical protein